MIVLYVHWVPSEEKGPDALTEDVDDEVLPEYPPVDREAQFFCSHLHSASI